jgi:hypothetical protein
MLNDKVFPIQCLNQRGPERVRALGTALIKTQNPFRTRLFKG